MGGTRAAAGRVGVFVALWAAACALLLLSSRYSSSSVAIATREATRTRVKVFSQADAFGIGESFQVSGRVSTQEKLGESEGSIALVETLPVGEVNLTSTAQLTFEALIERVQAANETIDLSAMYWNLLGKEDRAIFSDEEMRKFGADRGEKLFEALRDAVKRGVVLRILTAKESPGSESDSSVQVADLPEEVQQLVAARPDRVHVRCWSGPEWYGSGILHQKIWLFDQKHLYVGSANMDWKSLAQVMEVGVLMKNLSPQSLLIRDLQRLFDAWWLWADPDRQATTSTYYSERFQLELKVPSWSVHLPDEDRLPDPFVDAGLSALGNSSHQIHANLKFSSDQASSTTPADVFIAAAPIEVTAGHSREFDEDALVYTIKSAKTRLSLSVMDFAPYSMFTPSAIWWPALTDAILSGLYSKPNLQIRLLISEWQHTNPQMQPALKLLNQQGLLCRKMRAACSGMLEIRVFRVPGWQDTKSTPGHKGKWPEHTRVNHAKYIVSDARVNVGTSNMEWGYFYTTAGASVNTNHEPTRQAFETLFDRNWDSPYAQVLAD